jgi:hypothetical protein
MVSKLEEVLNMPQMVKCHVVLRIPEDLTIFSPRT